MISIFILVIAWVNYVNLSTARAVDRAKEVGLRKVIGAYKSQVMMQFVFESFLVNLLSAVCAVGLAELMLPAFNQLIDKEVTEHVWNNFGFLQQLGLFFVLGTVLSGFYPAVVLSGFKPVTVLRGKFRNSRKGVLLRKSLVVIQFAASLILIASTFIVNRQVSYMLNKDLGIDIDYVIGFRNPRYTDDESEQMAARYRSFKAALNAHPSVLNSGMTTNLPGGGSSDISSSSGGLKLVGHTDRIEGTFTCSGMMTRFFLRFPRNFCMDVILITRGRWIQRQ